MPRELANEPRNPGDYTGEVLREWIAEMSHFVEALASMESERRNNEALLAISRRPI